MKCISDQTDLIVPVKKEPTRDILYRYFMPIVVKYTVISCLFVV